jgi:hypothetical protein
VLGRYQPWKHHDSAAPNGNVMEPAVEIAATKLEHLQLSAGLAIYRRCHVERQDAMGDAMEL